MKLLKHLSVFEIFSKGEALEKKLLRNHLLAVLVLITMVSISFLILTTIIKTQHNSSNLLNTSGKQRMYTQKVLYNFSKYINDKQIKSKQSLFESLDKLQKNNVYLTSKLTDKNSISYNNKELTFILNSSKGAINKFKEYKQSIQNYILKPNAILRQSIENQGEALLNIYDHATLQYQKLSEDKVNQFLLIETTLFIISLLTIFLEAVLIFRPAILEVFVKHAQLRELNENLSNEVKKQVEVLREQEELLIQQSKLAEMGEMLSNISHQWKQPLTILSMQIEDLEMALMHDEINKIKMQEDIEKCFDQIGLMSNTIEDFKRFYMPDNEKKAFNVHDMIMDVVKMEKGALQNCTITHEIKCEDKSIVIFGFESQLKQVLLSLTNNAIEQISQKIDEKKLLKTQGSIEYAIEIENKQVIISVYDNASGIAKSIIDEIFKPYFSTKQNSGGSGIGLHMAKTIIEKNFEGTLSVKNKTKGAKFYITIPLNNSDNNI